MGSEFDILHVRARGQMSRVIAGFDPDDAVRAPRIISIKHELRLTRVERMYCLTQPYLMVDIYLVFTT